ncbi:unnamed protein product [Amoebophrya sp. A120]|nr:unnamed protein product [Amoebophrya sp. A120]|eukprot:GSA120T00016009001.1
MLRVVLQTLFYFAGPMAVAAAAASSTPASSAPSRPPNAILAPHKACTTKCGAAHFAPTTTGDAIARKTRIRFGFSETSAFPELKETECAECYDPATQKRQLNEYGVHPMLDKTTDDKKYTGSTSTSADLDVAASSTTSCRAPYAEIKTANLMSPSSEVVDSGKIVPNAPSSSPSSYCCRVRLCGRSEDRDSSNTRRNTKAGVLVEPQGGGQRQHLHDEKEPREEVEEVQGAAVDDESELPVIPEEEVDSFFEFIFYQYFYRFLRSLSNVFSLIFRALLPVEFLETYLIYPVKFLFYDFLYVTLISGVFLENWLTWVVLLISYVFGKRFLQRLFGPEIVNVKTLRKRNDTHEKNVTPEFLQADLQKEEFAPLVLPSFYLKWDYEEKVKEIVKEEVEKRVSESSSQGVVAAAPGTSSSPGWRKTTTSPSGEKIMSEIEMVGHDRLSPPGSPLSLPAVTPLFSPSVPVEDGLQLVTTGTTPSGGDLRLRNHLNKGDSSTSIGMQQGSGERANSQRPSQTETQTTIAQVITAATSSTPTRRSLVAKTTGSPLLQSKKPLAQPTMLIPYSYVGPALKQLQITPSIPTKNLVEKEKDSEQSDVSEDDSNEGMKSPLNSTLTADGALDFSLNREDKDIDFSTELPLLTPMKSSAVVASLSSNKQLQPEFNNNVPAASTVRTAASSSFSPSTRPVSRSYSAMHLYEHYKDYQRGQQHQEEQLSVKNKAATSSARPTTSKVTTTSNVGMGTLCCAKVSYNSILQSSNSNTYELGQTPLLCFVNPKSGGQEGYNVLRKLRSILHPLQVINLKEKVEIYEPIDVLKWFIQTFGASRVRILICGGDGTCDWVLDMLDQLDSKYGPELFQPDENYPPVGIYPLGTGNDLARVFGWTNDSPFAYRPTSSSGSGSLVQNQFSSARSLFANYLLRTTKLFSSEKHGLNVLPRNDPIREYLTELVTARACFLDRWQVTTYVKKKPAKPRKTTGAKMNLAETIRNTGFALEQRVVASLRGRSGSGKSSSSSPTEDRGPSVQEGSSAGEETPAGGNIPFPASTPLTSLADEEGGHHDATFAQPISQTSSASSAAVLANMPYKTSSASSDRQNTQTVKPPPSRTSTKDESVAVLQEFLTQIQDEDKIKKIKEQHITRSGSKPPTGDSASSSGTTSSSGDNIINTTPSGLALDKKARALQRQNPVFLSSKYLAPVSTSNGKSGGGGSSEDTAKMKIMDDRIPVDELVSLKRTNSMANGSSSVECAQPISQTSSASSDGGPHDLQNNMIIPADSDSSMRGGSENDINTNKSTEYEQYTVHQQRVASNYIGIGADGAVITNFHDLSYLQTSPPSSCNANLHALLNTRMSNANLHAACKSTEYEEGGHHDATFAQPISQTSSASSDGGYLQNNGKTRNQGTSHQPISQTSSASSDGGYLQNNIIPADSDSSMRGGAENDINTNKSSEYEQYTVHQQRVASNYIGIGADGAVITNFHDFREELPGFFVWQKLNVWYYMALGLIEVILRSCNDLPKRVKITCDNREYVLEDGNIEGIIISNIGSYAGGSRLWDGTADFREILLENNELLGAKSSAAPDFSPPQSRMTSRDSSPISGPMAIGSSRLFVRSTKGEDPDPDSEVGAGGTVGGPLSTTSSDDHYRDHMKNFYPGRAGSSPGTQTDSDNSPSGSVGKNRSGTSSTSPTKEELSSCFQKISPGADEKILNEDSVQKTTKSKMPGAAARHATNTATSSPTFSAASSIHNPSSFHDNLLDVVLIRGAEHLALISIGMDRAIRLCQCKKIEIDINSTKPIPLQIDGEPWSQPGISKMTIELKQPRQQVVMLKKIEHGLGEKAFVKTLQSGIEKGVILPWQRDALLKEMSLCLTAEEGRVSLFPY